MKSMTDISHAFLSKALHPHSICVDATLGHANDSLFFLNRPHSRVFAFEIQEELVEEGRNRIQDPSLSIFWKGHEFMGSVLQEYTGKVDAIIFNFGWDPKKPDTLCTEVSTSLTAVQAAITLLRKKGRMALVFYPHETGEQEKKEILSWLKTIPETISMLVVENPLAEHSPSVAMIEKKSCTG